MKSIFKLVLVLVLAAGCLIAGCAGDGQTVSVGETEVAVGTNPDGSISITPTEEPTEPEETVEEPTEPEETVEEPTEPEETVEEPLCVEGNLVSIDNKYIRVTARNKRVPNANVTVILYGGTELREAARGNPVSGNVCSFNWWKSLKKLFKNKHFLKGKVTIPVRVTVLDPTGNDSTGYATEASDLAPPNPGEYVIWETAAFQHPDGKVSASEVEVTAYQWSPLNVGGARKVTLWFKSTKVGRACYNLGHGLVDPAEAHEQNYRLTSGLQTTFCAKNHGGGVFVGQTEVPSANFGLPEVYLTTVLPRRQGKVGYAGNLEER